MKNIGKYKELWERQETVGEIRELRGETRGFGERQEMWERMENFKKRRVTYGRRMDYF